MVHLILYRLYLDYIYYLDEFWYLGYEDDGDIYKPKNISSLEKYAMKTTEGKGVHFVMADGVSSIYI